LLLHGLNGHSGTWRNNVPFLSKENHVVAPSLPPSHGSPSELDVSRYVDMVEQFLAKLELGRVSIAGNSMGGWIAMKLANRRPEWIESLILEDSAGIAGSGQADNDLPDKIDALHMPILIIWGKEDRVLPLDAGRYLQSQIHESSFVVLDGVGHVPHWEKPDLYNQLVSDFLRRVREKQSRSDR
jgi:pimeloyl-ACP methyl ester carboxylesterase